MAESAERRPLVSLMRIVDDTLQEVGLPGPFDILPNVSEVIHFFGIPTLDDLGESLKARLSADLSTRRPKLPF